MGYHGGMRPDDRQVGIRELKEHTSAVVRRVKEGASIRITERGRPVAMIVPLRDDQDFWDRLLAEGRLVPAEFNLADELEANPPQPRQPGEGSPFDALMDLRANER